MADFSCTDDHYINRELSWLEFNQRVLEEALSGGHPLLERVKFLSICASNLDEFVMIRVSGLQHQVDAGQGSELSDDGISPAEQLAMIRIRIRRMQEEIGSLWLSELLPALSNERIRIAEYESLDDEQRTEVSRYYSREIFPVLTPLAIDPAHPFPHISNLSMNLAIAISDPVQGRRFARMKIPGTLPRLVPFTVKVSSEAGKESGGLVPQARRATQTLPFKASKQHQSRRDGHKRNGDARHKRRDSSPPAQLPPAPYPGHEHGTYGFVWLEQVVAANINTLFPGLDVLESHAFRITRSADIEIQEDEASDLLQTIEEGLRQRHFGPVARLEMASSMPAEMRDLLTNNLLVDPADVSEVSYPLGLSDLMEVVKADRPELKDPPLVTRVPPELQPATDERRADEFFAAIADKDILLHHPYDSFRPVIAFIECAAHDSQVQAIKQTLYRVGSRSPVVRALSQARDDDTQVAVLVELKARFDEENNIVWARALEDAGVHVVYGLLGLKTHCKMALVVRRESGGLRRYLHLGTGNYNSTTARVYTDFSLFTASEALTSDVSELFNLLTGYSRQTEYRKLLVAPVNMRERLKGMIVQEAHCARRGKPARLIFKMNALVDREIICALYEASKAGVRIDLIVRGVCCLRPGVPGLSDNIRVISIVGRFLEHSRAYYFENGDQVGQPALYVGSADMMPRNLDRRVEVLFPIEDEGMLTALRDDVLLIDLLDTLKAWQLTADGTWIRVQPAPGARPFSAQQHFLNIHREQIESEMPGLPELKFTPASIYPPLGA